jgi:hypothetical protein
VKKGIARLRSRSVSQDTEGTDHSPDTPDGDVLLPTPWRTNSGRDEPRVLHGYTATTEVPFRDVCGVVRDYAFRTTDLPLIVSLEVHCGHQQQEIMVEIMRDYWKQYLVPVPEDLSDDTPLPSLESLKKRILVKVKYSPPEKAAKEKAPDMARARASSNASGNLDSDDEEAQVQPAKKGKICEALGQLGIYTRSCKFRSFDQPEAKIPTHVFALSERKLLSLHEEDQLEALTKHNMGFLMRAYPKGTRVRSTNLDPAPFWCKGIQMVALNWQILNAAVMLNEAMFAGTGGWALKPAEYRQKGAPSSQRKGLTLSVNVMAAQGLDKTVKSAPKPYVKCELHVQSDSEKEGQVPKEGKNKGGEYRRRSGVQHSHDPDFGGEMLLFDGVQEITPALSFLRYVSCHFLLHIYP